MTMTMTMILKLGGLLPTQRRFKEEVAQQTSKWNDLFRFRSLARKNNNNKSVRLGEAARVGNAPDLV